MNTAVPILGGLAAIGVMIGMGSLISRIRNRKLQRDWESGNSGAAGLGGAAGYHGGSSGIGGGCAGDGAGGCGGGGCGGGGCGGGG
jgi:hypothetical protein